MLALELSTLLREAVRQRSLDSLPPPGGVQPGLAHLQPQGQSAVQPPLLLAQGLLAPLDLMDRAELCEVGLGASQAIGGSLDQIRQQSHQAHPIGVQTAVLLAETLPDLPLYPPPAPPQPTKPVFLPRPHSLACLRWPRAS